MVEEIIEKVQHLEAGEKCEDDEQARVYFTREVNEYDDEEHGPMLNDFIIEGTIGKGAFSTVKKVIRIFKGEKYEYAVKRMNRRLLEKERCIRYDADGGMDFITSLEKVYSEIDVWGVIRHPNIIKLFEVIDDPSHEDIFLVMEKADLGQIAKWNSPSYVPSLPLIQDVIAHYHQHIHPTSLTETQKRLLSAKTIFKQFLKGLTFLHTKLSIAHRDLKLDNLLFSSSDHQVKICDFTVSMKFKTDEDLSFDEEGTAAYMAPECFTQQDGFKPKPTDIWSFGICLYAFVSGKIPFFNEDLTKMHKSQENDPINFEGEIWIPELKEVLEAMLQKEPEKRPTVVQLAEFNWFKDN